MLLEVKNVRKQYQRQTLFCAVDNVSFSLQQLDYACIMGRSGSGKTTLLNIIAGISTPTQGRIIIDNTDIAPFDDEQASQFRNQTIGYVPQGSSLLTNLTAMENICLPYYLHSKNRQPDNIEYCNKRAQQLMQMAEIGHLSEIYPNQMSGGEMRRVAIVRALICSPKLLLADEPTNDLDDESSRQIMQLFSGLHSQGTTILLVTHDHEVANYASKHFKMVAGKLTDYS